MISDPCHAPLKEGFFGTSEGYLQRFHSTVMVSTTPGNTCGFFLWCPDRHGVSSANAPGGGNINSLMFHSGDPDFEAVNSANDPLGLGVDPYSAGRGMAVQDPASSFVDSTTSIAADDRHASSCMRLIYNGTISSCAGEIAFIENLPFEQVLAGSQPVTDISVNSLFQRATKTQRLGLDTQEIVFRPDVVSPPYWVNHYGGGAFFGGNPGTLASYVSPFEANTRPRWFGFAFRGMTNDLISNLRFDRFKIVEWRPNKEVGIPGVIPKTTSSVDPIREAMKMLDRIPEWSTKIIPSALSVGSRLAQLALTGT